MKSVFTFLPIVAVLCISGESIQNASSYFQSTSNLDQQEFCNNQPTLPDSAKVYIIRKGAFQGSATMSSADLGNNVLIIQKNKTYTSINVPAGNYKVSTNSIGNLGQFSVIKFNMNEEKSDNINPYERGSIIGINENELYFDYTNHLIHIDNRKPHKRVYKYAELYGDIKVQTYPFVETQSMDIQFEPGKIYYINYKLGGIPSLASESEGKKLISKYSPMAVKFKMNCASLNSNKIIRDNTYKFPYYNDCNLFPLEGIEVVDIGELMK